MSFSAKLLIALAVSLASFSYGSLTRACVPVPRDSDLVHASDAVIKGRFMRDANKAQRGEIVAIEHKSGLRAKTYPVQWDHDQYVEAASDLPSCGGRLPKDGHMAIFALFKDKGGVFRFYELRGTSEEPLPRSPEE